MYLLLKEALEKAEKDLNVKKMMTEGYFLCSVFASVQNSVNEWILHFYSSRTNKIVDCSVGESVLLGEETPAEKKFSKLEADKIKISAEQALEKAKKKFKGSAANTLMTLHKKKGMVWTINMIAPNMTATTYNIDAETGKLLSKDTTSLITTYSRGS